MKTMLFPQPLAPMVPQRKRSVGSANVRPQSQERRSSAITNYTMDTSLSAAVTIDTYGGDTLRSKAPLSAEFRQHPQIVDADDADDGSTIATQSMTVPFNASHATVSRSTTRMENTTGTPFQTMPCMEEDPLEKTVGSSSASTQRSSTISIDKRKSLRDDCETSNSSNERLTKDVIRAHLKDLYDDFTELLKSNSRHQRDGWNCFFERYYKTGFCWMRASGNPIGKEGLVNMFVQDLEGISFSLVSVDSVQILSGGTVAVATITADQTFRYKGEYNADRTVVSTILEWVDGDIKIVHEHRCKGGPIPSTSRW